MLSIVATALGILALLSFALAIWQFAAGMRFPLHRRAVNISFAPPLTVLKPLKGCDAETESCLKSWLAQEYSSPVQILFGVASADDPVCNVVQGLLGEFPGSD